MILHRLSAGDPVAINVDYGRLHHICLDRAASAGLYNVFPVNILPNTWTITLATSLARGMFMCKSQALSTTKRKIVSDFRLAA
ncbi:hypothetical protein M422DRAFT_275593 [Sphaerobolus stellatus SS14]|uniref:Unplaced genomic scaffold SPHSTscaffold_518, whole genome shotgun sequence n=1 Tax=Sphaerobolus stellatus (strain SS14) TaxID=990650 RepID=A0A0C9UEY2_SPHS4|nr:hypothetical protein M422DRAFT_275593 [Sphaerobolus stellatus SS14]